MQRAADAMQLKSKLLEEKSSYARVWGVGETKTSVGGFGVSGSNGLVFEPYDSDGQGD